MNQLYYNYVDVGKPGTYRVCYTQVRCALETWDVFPGIKGLAVLLTQPSFYNLAF